MEFYGTKGKAKLWFQSYLINRYQRVSITKNMLNQSYPSTCNEIKHGVLRGTILGPLLFLLCINDLPKVVNDKPITILFADDSSILVTSTNKNDLQSKITATFNLINKWLAINSLSTNPTKTYYVQFTTKNKPKTQINICL
jgi:hypothetical protein